MVAGVVGRVLGLVGVGIAAGAAIAYWAGPIVGGLVRGVSTSDPLALTGAAVMLLALGAAASWLPARRASRVDPLAVLREN